MFEPYTKIPTNILFFEHGGPTREVWYYELPLPEGRKSYTKTTPMRFEEFAPCLAWWNERTENERAWKVSAETLRAAGCNLDVKNPNAARAAALPAPEVLVEEIIRKEERILELMAEIRTLLAAAPGTPTTADAEGNA